MNEKHEWGRWVRIQGESVWQGACVCGSGRTGSPVYDAHGIYFGISCSKCNRKPESPPYDEAIDEE